MDDSSGATGSADENPRTGIIDCHDTRCQRAVKVEAPVDHYAQTSSWRARLQLS
jgi:hypothetical protein